MSIATRSTAATALACLFGAAALAQSPDADVLVLDVDDLADGDTMEAEIMAADYDDRTLTVRFESGNEIARLIVPENADLVQMGPNNLAEREMRITDLHSGDRIEIEGVEVEGVLRLRIVGVES